MGLELVVADQVKVFAYAWLLGAALGLCYELFRIPRQAFRMPAWVVFLQDLLYVLLWALATFLFQMTFSKGQVRLYILVGEFLGWVLYYFTLGALLFRLSGAIIAGIRAVLHVVFGKILFPLVRLLLCPFRWLWRCFRRVASRSRGAIQRRYCRERQKHLERRQTRRVLQTQRRERKLAQKQAQRATRAAAKRAQKAPKRTGQHKKGTKKDGA